MIYEPRVVRRAPVYPPEWLVETRINVRPDGCLQVRRTRLLMHQTVNPHLFAGGGKSHGANLGVTAIFEQRKAERGMLAGLGFQAIVPILALLRTGALLRPGPAFPFSRWRLTAALALFPLLLFAQPQPEAGDELAEALERVYLETEYQQELPEAPEREVPAWLRWLAQFLSSLGGLSVLGQVLMWTSLVVVVLLLVYFLADANYGRLGERLRRRLRPKGQDGDAPSTPVTLRDWLRTADSLARKKQYAAAIHTLLLGVLGWMRASQVQEWPPAATAREILARHSGPREPLEFLVRNAELAHFGGWSGSNADYLACRAYATELTAMRSAVK